MLKGELKFIQEFSSKEQWFRENWISISKPQHRGVIGPSKKKKIYSAEQIYEMTITDTKTIKETITNLLLGMEESNRHTAKTQNKTTPNNVITSQ